MERLRMVLIHNGITLDSNEEHELFSDSEFGFEVIITGNRKKLVKVNNITEVHHLYNIKYDEPGKPKTAFESDIHSNEFVIQSTSVLRIEILNATKLSTEFCEDIEPEETE